MATRAATSDQFGPAVNLGPTINTSAFEGSPFITDDGLALFFGSNRAGGSGRLDLYVATRTTTSEPFGNPVNLGATINSSSPEFNPHIGPDGLYFQSSRVGGLGGNDLWFAAFAGTPGGNTIDLTIKNVQPVIKSISSTSTLSAKAMPGETVTVSGSFRDAGVLDTHTAIINWDDGTTSPAIISQTDGTFVADHVYSTGGIFEVIVTLTDDDTGDVVETVEVSVTGVRLDDATGELQIVGTNDDDYVSINQQGKETLKVHANFLPNAKSLTFSRGVEKIVAYLCDGDDHLTIAGNVDIPAIVHGGNNDDHIKSGGGPAILLGDAGNDMLIGGGVQNILIGGAGADRLVGGRATDVLIGGRTVQDDDDFALMSALVEASILDDYDDLITAITSLLVVQDDGLQDVITGGSGRDLFFDGIGDTLTDVKSKRDRETVL